MFKIKLLIVGLFLGVSAFSQSSSFGLPTVYAEGGEGKNKVWVRPSKKVLEETIGWIWSDCSNHISDGTIVASSILAPQGSASYSTKNLADDDPTTAWVEGKPDYGIGEYIEAKAISYYRELVIYNGYQKSPRSFLDNSRVKTLMVSENGINRSVIHLKDEMGAQSVNFDELGLKLFNNNRLVKLRLTILEVYPGQKYKDVAISEIYHNGCCIAGDAELLLENELPLKLENFSEDNVVKFLDGNGDVLNLKVNDIGSVVHHSMIKINASNGKTITVAPYHKVYANDLHELKTAEKLQAGDYIFSFVNGIVDSSQVISIEKLTGEVKTFYFKNIELPNSPIKWPLKAIVNGFIVSDEYIDKLNQKALLYGKAGRYIFQAK
jgi:hypothetical protein